MKWNNQNKGLAILAIIAVVIVVVFASGALTIVSSSQVSFDSVQNKWLVTNVVVNGNDHLAFTKDNLYTTNLSNPTLKSAQAQTGFSLITTPDTPYCSYNLGWATFPLQSIFGIPINSVPYATLGSKTQHAPYKISIVKSDGTREDKPVDASILGQAQLQFFNGQVVVQNLGQLNNGVTCPDSSGAVLLPVYDSQGKTITKWALASASDWDSYKRSTQLDYASCILNPQGCVSQIVHILSAPPVQKPYSFSQFTSSSIDTISQGATNLIGYLPIGSSYANVLISVDGSFVNTLVVKKPNGKPQISLAFSTTSFDQSHSSTMTVTVKNIGSTGDNFQINPTTTGVVNFSPQANQTGNIEPNQSVSKSFAVYALGSGTPTVTVDVQAIGSGQNASSSQLLNINATNLPPESPPQQIEICGNGQCVSAAGETQQTCPQDCGVPQGAICGNGVCEAGEILSCPNDCPNGGGDNSDSQKTCESQKVDGIFIIGHNYNTHGVGALIQSPTCDPIYNWAVILLIIAGIIVVVFFGYVLVNKKGKR